MREIWKVSPSLPDYEVSNRGRVRRVPYTKAMPNGGARKYGGIAHTGADAKNRRIFSYKGKSYKVHRLVCEAFNGPPPFSGAVVMHIDENYHNNNADNLRWATQKQNLNSPGFLAYCRARTGDDSPRRKGMVK